jgi:drug/metabolite transporter (DMT)-like permease
MRLLVSLIGLLMLAAPFVYGVYNAYRKGYLKPVLTGVAWALFGLAWVSSAVWLLTRA